MARRLRLESEEGVYHVLNHGNYRGEAAIAPAGPIPPLDADVGMGFIGSMKANWIERDGHVIDLPNLSAVVEKDGAWFVSRCPELGVASQGKTRQEAHKMLTEAVGLWLESASAVEIRRRCGHSSCGI